MRVCGTSRYSMLQLQRAAKEMGLTFIVHRISKGNGQPLRAIVGAGVPSLQLVGGLHSFRRRALPTLVTDCLSALSNTNLPIYNEADPQLVIEKALTTPKIEPDLNQPELLDYVEIAASPSHLMEIQTAIYRISNLPLRKQIQAAIIQFLDSRLSATQLKKLLSSSSKLEPLSNLMDSKESLALRDAVAQYRQGTDIAQLELETKFTSFDIMYITRSSENNGDGNGTTPNS